MLQTHATSKTLDTVAQRLGLTGLYVFAFGAWLGIALANLGLLLMLIAFLLDWRRLLTAVRISYWPWLTAVSMLALTVAVWDGMPADGDVAVKHVEDARRLALLWLFLLVGWWMAGDTRRIATALILASVGFVIGRLTALNDLGGLMILNPGDRPGFGLPTLAFAQYTATLFVALCLLGPRIQSLAHGLGPRLLLTIAWMCAIAISLSGLILAEARMVWIATIAVLIPAVATMWLHAQELHSQGVGQKVKGRSIWAVVGLLMLAIIALNSERVSTRISAETEAYAPVLSGDLDEAGYGAVGLRAHAWRYALELIETRPWFGWGPGATRALMASHEAAPVQALRDFHNTPLEFLVTVGIFGTLPFVMAFCIALVALFRAFHQKHLPLDLFLIVISALVLHQLSGLTNSRIFNPDWTHLWLLFGGAATTFASHVRICNKAVTPP